MIFDDTYEHEAWNDTDRTRVVLFVDFVRPLRAPGTLGQRRACCGRSPSPRSSATPSAATTTGRSASRR